MKFWLCLQKHHSQHKEKAHLTGFLQGCCVQVVDGGYNCTSALVLKLNCMLESPVEFFKKNIPMLGAYLQRCWFNWFGAQPRHWNFSKLPRWFKGAVKFKNYCINVIPVFIQVGPLHRSIKEASACIVWFGTAQNISGPQRAILSFSVWKTP